MGLFSNSWPSVLRCKPAVYARVTLGKATGFVIMKSLFLVSPNPFYFDTPNNKIPMVIKKTALFMIFPRYNYDRIVHIFP